MATDRYSNIGRNGVVKEGIFVRFPDLIPASTDNYSNSEFHKKLLMLEKAIISRTDSIVFLRVLRNGIVEMTHNI